MKKKSFFIVIFLFTIGFALLNVENVFAASSSISVSPTTATHNVGDVFSVDIVADGAGQAFNVGQADVFVSSNLEVDDVVFGDCNFAFVKTPSTSSLNFVGGILGGQSTKCTVLTAQIRVLSAGTGHISLTNAKLKSYPDSKEMSPVTVPGYFTLSGSGSDAGVSPQEAVSRSIQTATNQPAITQMADTGEYSVSVKVVSSTGQPIAGATVAFMRRYDKSGLVQVQVAKTDANGVAEVLGIQSGAYQIVAKKGNNQLASQIVTINKANGPIKIGLKASADNTIATNSIVVIVVLILLVAGGFFYRKKLFALLHRNK